MSIQRCRQNVLTYTRFWNVVGNRVAAVAAAAYPDERDSRDQDGGSPQGLVRSRPEGVRVLR